MIFHLYSDYMPSDPDTVRRQRIAQTTWPRQPWRELPVKDVELPRLFMQGDRAFPYVRDVFDAGVKDRKDEDIIVYTNADIMVRGDCCSRIAEALLVVDACYCYRRDWHHRVESPPPDADFCKANQYAGHDLTAFRAGWWREYRGYMPDMVIAAEAWDPTIRQLIDETNPQGCTVLHDLICHERHGSFWENPAHRYKLKMQLHNLALAKAFFMARGIPPSRHGIR